MKSIYKASLAIFAVALMIAVPFAVIDIEDSDAAKVVSGDGAVSFKNTNAMKTDDINAIFSENFLKEKILKTALCESTGLDYTSLTCLSMTKITYEEMLIQAGSAANLTDGNVLMRNAEKYDIKLTITGKGTDNLCLFDTNTVCGLEKYNEYIGKINIDDDISITIEFSIAYYANYSTTFITNSKGDLYNSYDSKFTKSDVNLKSAVIKITPVATPTDIKTVTVKARMLDTVNTSDSFDYSMGIDKVTSDTNIRKTIDTVTATKFTGTYEINGTSYTYYNDNPNHVNSAITNYQKTYVFPVSADLTVATCNLCYYAEPVGTELNYNILFPYVTDTYKDNAALKTKLATIGTCADDYSTGNSIIDDVSNSIASMYDTSSSSETNYIAFIIGFLGVLLLLCALICFVKKE